MFIKLVILAILIFPLQIFPNIFYIRPPKTGSTTVISLLKDQYSENLFYEHIGAYLGNSKSWIKAIRKMESVRPINENEIVIGHFPVWFINAKTTDKQRECAFWFTTLREPVDRITSYYYYNARDPKKKHVDPWKIKPNEMCRILASDPSLEGEELLKNAISNLEKMDLVIFLDDFERGIEQLCDFLSITTPNEIPKLNQSRRRAFTKETLSKIRQANELDIQLYQHAKQYCRARNSA